MGSGVLKIRHLALILGNMALPGYAGFSVHRAYRKKYLSGKQKGGGGCFMIKE
jgi:hypothetical protein